MTHMKWIVSLMVAATALGCGSGKSYQVEVKNQTLQPVTLWLTKDGPPKEVGWFAPEDLAQMPADAQTGYDLAIVPPGKTGFTGNVSGDFPKGTNAVLRVYEGQKELFHILEDAKAGRSNRVDQVLKPGMNRFSVVDRDGTMIVEPSR
jgi:hypothetical protein